MEVLSGDYLKRAENCQGFAFLLGFFFLCDPRSSTSTLNRACLGHAYQGRRGGERPSALLVYPHPSYPRNTPIGGLWIMN